MNPDAETKSRIKNLGIVGTTLLQAFSEENQDFGTNFVYAKEALERFRDGINRLELDEPSKKGMNDLVDFLYKELEKRENVDNPYM